MESVFDEKDRYKRTCIKYFYTHNSFKYELFVIGAFLQYTTYTAILYFGNGNIGANGVRYHFICKQKGKWSVFT